MINNLREAMPNSIKPEAESAISKHQGIPCLGCIITKPEANKGTDITTHFSSKFSMLIILAEKRHDKNHNDVNEPLPPKVSHDA